MIQKNITQTVDGVDIQLTGDIKKAKLETMTSNCNNDAGCSCECNNDMKEHIQHIEISGEDGNLTLSLKGERLEASKIAEALSTCDMEKHL